MAFVNAGLHYGFSVFEGILCCATTADQPFLRSTSTQMACSIPRSCLPKLGLQIERANPKLESVSRERAVSFSTFIIQEIPVGLLGRPLIGT